MVFLSDIGVEERGAWLFPLVTPARLLPQRLQELHLQENSIELLSEEALSGLSSLALLDLSRNHLRTLGASSLTPLVSLQVLRVTGGWKQKLFGVFRSTERLCSSSDRLTRTENFFTQIAQIQKSVI